MSELSQSATNSTTIFVQAGDTVCQPPTWVDVAKFFIFNYGLHTLTVVTPPGSSHMETIAIAFSALMLPFSGTLRAIMIIYRFAWSESGSLKSAQKAGALCMMWNVGRNENIGDVSLLPPARLLMWNVGRNDNIGDVSLLPPARLLMQPWTQKILARLLPPDEESLQQKLERLWPFAGRLLKEVKGQSAGDPESLQSAGDPRYNCILPSTTVHGQYYLDNSKSHPGSSDRYHLIQVPRTMEVKPLPEPNDCYSPLEIACNYNYIKGFAAILQILYWSWELWKASDKKLARWGYAAYPLTVAPYIIMSLINLIASLCQEEYPAMFLIEHVERESPSPPAAEESKEVQSKTSPVDMKTSSVNQKKMVVGAIGLASGNVTNCGILDEAKSRMGKNPVKEWIMRIVSLILILLSLAGPYIITYCLTRFSEGGSTRSQRAWLMSWLVVGQFYGVRAYFSSHMYITAALCAPAIGGLVVVAQMILQDDDCGIL